MNAATSETVFVGTFADSARAEHFVHELRKAGFRDEEIGVLTPHGDSTLGRVEDTALAGAMAGGTVGVLAGLALVVGLVPGVGPVLAGGVLAGALGGAAVGAGAGGLLAGLIALGLPEDQARHHAGQVQAGRTVVTVQGPGRVAEALAIFRRCEAKKGADAKAPTPALEVEELDPLRGDGP